MCVCACAPVFTGTQAPDIFEAFFLFI